METWFLIDIPVFFMDDIREITEQEAERLASSIVKFINLEEGLCITIYGVVYIYPPIILQVFENWWDVITTWSLIED